MNLDRIQAFKAAYGTRTDKQLAHQFRTSVSEVRRLARQFRLSKDKKRFPGQTMPRWTDTEIQTLKELYPDRPTVEVAKTLGKSTRAVASRAHRLGLVKNEERMSEMGIENVSLRRDR